MHIAWAFMHFLKEPQIIVMRHFPILITKRTVYFPLALCLQCLGILYCITSNTFTRLQNCYENDQNLPYFRKRLNCTTHIGDSLLHFMKTAIKPTIQSKFEKYIQCVLPLPEADLPIGYYLNLVDSKLQEKCRPILDQKV